MPFATTAIFEFDSDDDVDKGEWAFRNKRAARRKLSLQQSRISKRRMMAEKKRARKKLAEYEPASCAEEAEEEEGAITQQPSVASVSSGPSTTSSKAHVHNQGQMYQLGISKSRTTAKKQRGNLMSPKTKPNNQLTPLRDPNPSKTAPVVVMPGSSLVNTQALSKTSSRPSSRLTTQRQSKPADEGKQEGAAQKDVAQTAAETSAPSISIEIPPYSPSSSPSSRPQNPPPSPPIPPTPTIEIPSYHTATLSSRPLSNSQSLADLFAPPSSVSKQGSFLRSKFSTVEKMRESQLEMVKKKDFHRTLRKFALTQEVKKPIGTPTTENTIAEIDVVKLIMVREHYLVNLSDLVNYIDTEYKSFVSSKRTLRILSKKQKKIKAAAGVTNVEIGHINGVMLQTEKRMKALRNILKQTHGHLAVIMAHLRAISIEVVEAVAAWQSKLVLHQKKFDVTGNISNDAPLESSILPPPFIWEKQNYLLKILDDFSFFSDKDILKQWLGFDPTSNAFFVPTDDLDVDYKIKQRKARLTHDLRKRRETASKARATILRQRMTGEVGRGAKRQQRKYTIYILPSYITNNLLLVASLLALIAVGVIRKKVNVINAFAAAGSKGFKIKTPKSPKRGGRGINDRTMRKSLTPKGIAKAVQNAVNDDDAVRKERASTSVGFSTAKDTAGPTAAFTNSPRKPISPTESPLRSSQDLTFIRDTVFAQLNVGGDSSPQSTKSPPKGNDSDSGSDSDSDRISSGEEAEVSFPDVIPTAQIINPLPGALLERCRNALDTIAEERRSDYMRTQKRQELEDFRNTNFNSYRPNTVSVDSIRVLKSRGGVDKTVLMNRSTYARPATADFAYGFEHDDSTEDFKSTFFMTQASQVNEPPHSRILSPARQQRALQHSLAMRGASPASKLNTVFVSNPARFSQSPFPTPLAGNMLVNSEVSVTGLLFRKYNTTQATVIVQGFGRFILVKNRTRELKNFRQTSMSASLIQRAWRGKKGRSDFFKKLRTKKAGDIRARIEAREIQKAAAVLQRFFDNIRASSMEKEEAVNRERRRVQERLWMRKAMLDAAAFQIQRVYRRYLSAKREWEYDYGVKHHAASIMQGGVRMRLARKLINERKKMHRQNLRNTILPTKREPAAEFHRALLTLQCWARVYFASATSRKKRAKREGQLIQKLVSVHGGGTLPVATGGILYFDDDESVGSVATASITMLMGAVAATEAATVAKAYVDVDVEKEEERVRQLEEADRVRPGSRKGASARRKITMAADE